MKRVILAATCAAFVASCATAPDKIKPYYVSPVQYSTYDCDHVRTEMIRVSDQVRVLVGKQNKKHKNDQVAMGVGLVLFWPALFFLIGGDKKEELAELKGEYDALVITAKEKNCEVVQELTQAPPPAAKSH